MRPSFVLEKPSSLWKSFFSFLVWTFFIFLVLFYLLTQRPPEKVRPVQKAPVDPSVNPSQKMIDTISAADLSFLSYEEWAQRYELTGSGQDDADQDGLSNELEYQHLTNPTKADTDNDGYTDQQEVVNGYDPADDGKSRPKVEIAINKIQVSAPMVWSKNNDESSILQDLQSGVSHLAGTASPGQIGNMIITGHSSNYFWIKSPYNNIFQNLNNLEKGDFITFTTTQQNGRVITYHYQVNDKKITTADDASVLAPTSQPILTLSTCWPIGTNLKRLVLQAQLVN